MTRVTIGISERTFHWAAKKSLLQHGTSAMTLEQWTRARVNAEHLSYLDRNPKGYFEAVDLLDRLEKVLGK